MRLILHLGTHKTGTTSVQRALSDRRASLRGRGIVYPDTHGSLGGSRQAHHRLAHALTGTDPRQLKAAHRSLEHLAAEVGDAQTVVLSAEPFYRHVAGSRDTWTVDDYWPRRRRYLTAVADALSPWRVTVLLYLRPPDELAASLYLEAVAAGTCTTSFERFLADRRPFFDYSAQVALLGEVFTEVEVRRYGPDVVADVFAFLGAGRPPSTPPRARPSPDPRLVLWCMEQTDDRARLRRFMGSRLASHRFATRAQVGMWTSAAQRDAFLQRFTGPYGPGFFEPPAAQLPPPADLDAVDRRALDRRYRIWRALDPLQRRLIDRGGADG